MIEELDRIILTEDLSQYGLKKGDIGTVVLQHNNSNFYEVEFVTLDGDTIAIITLENTQIRPIAEREIATVRSLV
ncbi:DUF4926 domain-containing protein [Ancylothrix sp. C2]|uniref:DUF4926 domain-containing protein n=1 Tax=Ancylothrix sp. D3o TaxID=2953691 RepID=UPI0021BBB5A5|nr:DUF4926 domain-containing protein [Ancylothrix sp. D3o]MCT7952389.1 DUF4926 domain-containing protein [Ancylothrix sp. D3o]